MLRRIKARHHVVVAYLALFIALGGSAVAARPLLTGADIQDGSLTGADISDANGGSLAGADIQESDLGQVPNADTLDALDSTAFLRARVVTRYGPLKTLPNLARAASFAQCASGEKVVGGGWDRTGPAGGVGVYYNRASLPAPAQLPDPVLPADGEEATGWATFLINETGATLSFRAFAQCAG